MVLEIIYYSSIDARSVTKVLVAVVVFIVTISNVPNFPLVEVLMEIVISFSVSVLVSLDVNVNPITSVGLDHIDCYFGINFGTGIVVEMDDVISIHLINS